VTDVTATAQATADATAPPVATDVTAPPVAADVTAPPVAADVTAPPVAADVTAPPVAADVTAPPVATDVPAPPASKSKTSTKMASTLLAPALAPAAVPTNSRLMGGFEIDGDMTEATMTPPGVDWSNTPYVTLTDGAADPTGVGGKESQSPSVWTKHVVSTGKADLVHARVANRLVGNDEWLYVGIDRVAVTGTVYYVMEFNQLSNLINPAGLSVPQREDGDLRVTFVQQGNGPLGLESVSKWLSGGWVDQNVDPAAIFGLSNATDINVPPGDPAGATLAAGQFAELGFNLASQGFSSGCENTAYTQINFRTRESASESSNMEDIAGPLDVTIEPVCAFLNIHKTGPTTATSLPGATFSVTPNPNTGTGSLLITDGTVPGMTGAVADGAADGTIALKTDHFSPPPYAVQEVKAPAGYHRLPGLVLRAVGDVGPREGVSVAPDVDPLDLM